ncbi:MAG: hypothetical protein KH284_08500 [Clostridiales bacterium]|nr:hypothetical protein [Clostridiales bacterium]
MYLTIDFAENHGMIASNGSFEALEKCLSARNASCRTAATPFFAFDKNNIKIAFPAGPVKGSSLAIACQHTAQMRLAAIHENGSKTFSRFLSAGGFFDFLGKIRLRRAVYHR